MPQAHKLTLYENRIYARDVSITLQAPIASSILNVLSASITGIADTDSGQNVVRLQVVTHPLLAHIIHQSASLAGVENRHVGLCAD